MTIFKMLSEEVFEISSYNMTQVKAKHLKDTMCSEFPLVFHLCQHILLNSPNEALVGATLETLLRFSSWIPVSYIFHNKLVQTLIGEFLNVPRFQNVTLQCLSEIAGVTTGPEYDDEWVEMFSGTMSQLEKLLSLESNIKVEYANHGDDAQKFIQNMAMFLCTMLKQRGTLLERAECIS